MTCLTMTPPTAAEAIERRADLIVVHHPLPFHPALAGHDGRDDWPSALGIDRCRRVDLQRSYGV